MKEKTMKAMKTWKAVVLTGLAILLVVILASYVENYWKTREIRSRIANLEPIAREQRLIADILTAKYEAAVIKSKFAPAPQNRPVIEPPQVKE